MPFYSKEENISVCLFFSITYIYTQVLSYVGPILIKEHQSSGEVSNTLRSCKGEQGEQAILYRDILYTYILFFKPKKYIFSLIRVSHRTIFLFQCCKSYLLEAACQIEVDNYSLYQYILCQTVMSHPQRASHPK